MISVIAGAAPGTTAAAFPRGPLSPRGSLSSHALTTPAVGPSPARVRYRGNDDNPGSTPSGSGVRAVFITIASIW